MNKIAVTVIDNHEGSRIDSRFGRCQYFAVIDAQGNIAFVPNAVQQLPEHGAGIQAANKLYDLGVNLVLTGRVGPKASDAMQKLGITAYEGATGTLLQALSDFNEGRLRKAPQH